MQLLALWASSSVLLQQWFGNVTPDTSPRVHGSLVPPIENMAKAGESQYAAPGLWQADPSADATSRQLQADVSLRPTIRMLSLDVVHAMPGTYGLIGLVLRMLNISIVYTFLLPGGMFVLTYVLALADKIGFLEFEICLAIGLPVMWIICAAVACVYRDKISNKRLQWAVEGRESSPESGFHTGCLRCVECNDCCYLFFCPACRYADTVNAVGAGSFSVTIALFILYPLFVALREGSYLALLLLLDYNPPYMIDSVLVVQQLGHAGFVWEITLRIILITNRVRIRAALGLNPNCMCSDCLLWCCCPWCALCQEAHEVDRATGTMVRCCQELQLGGADSESLVGAAVSIENQGATPMNSAIGSKSSDPEPGNTPFRAMP